MFGVMYIGNGNAKVFRIGFASRNDAADWMEANCSEKERKAYVMPAHMANLNGRILLIWHGAD